MNDLSPWKFHQKNKLEFRWHLNRTYHVPHVFPMFPGRTEVLFDYGGMRTYIAGAEVESFIATPLHQMGRSMKEDLEEKFK